MIKRPIHKKAIRILSIYVLNDRASKYSHQTFNKPKRYVDKLTMIEILIARPKKQLQ